MLNTINTIYIINILFKLLIILSFIFGVLVAVAFFTLLERKFLGTLQRRRGPRMVGFWGLLQPFADALKLLIKESVIPSKSNKFLFIIAPILSLFLSISSWIVIPLSSSHSFLDTNLGLLFLFGVSSLGVYGIILAGWSSNSRYAFLGALRSAAQMVSYEVSFGLLLLSTIIFSSSINLYNIVIAQEYIWFIFPLFPIYFLFFISALAETNRPPFDLPEAEAELVAGYNVEYSAVSFALFFISEYSNILLMSTLSCLFFLGGWLPPFNLGYFFPEIFWITLKIISQMILFVWIRAVLPRYRYDQLMRLGWKVILPLSIFFLCFMVFLNLINIYE